MLFKVQEVCVFLFFLFEWNGGTQAQKLSDDVLYIYI